MHTLKLLRPITTSEIYARPAHIVRRHILKHLRLLSPDHELRNRRNVLIALRDLPLELNQPLGLRISQRLQKYSVNYGKDGRVGADAECQRQDSCGHEAWAAPQSAARKTDVLQQILRKVQRFHVATPPRLTY